MDKAQEVLKEARLEAIFAESWVDLSNRLFNPVDGIVSRAFPDQFEREWFVQTDEYQEIQGLLNRLMAKW